MRTVMIQSAVTSCQSDASNIQDDNLCVVLTGTTHDGCIHLDMFYYLHPILNIINIMCRNKSWHRMINITCPNTYLFTYFFLL